MAIFNAVYRPALIYGHEQWVMTERIRSRIRAAEMRFLRRAAGLTLRDRIRSSTIRESLKAESLLLHIERSQLRWLGHVLRMPRERRAHQVFEAMPQGKRPVGRPRLTWRNYVCRASMTRAIRSYMDRCHCFGQRSKSMEASTGHAYNLDPKGEEETKMMMMMMMKIT